MDVETLNDFLWSHLADSVKMELHCHGLDRDNDSDQIIACLRNIYGERRSCAQLMTILCRIEQKPDETVRAYSYRLTAAFRALTARQKDLNVSVTDWGFLRDYFVDNLRDRQVKRQMEEKVIEKPQATFLAIRDAAIRWAQDEISITEYTSVSAAPTRQPCNLSPTAANHPTNSDLGQLKKDLAALKLQLTGLLNQSKASPRTARGKTICYNCRKAGHIASKCQERVANIHPRQHKVSSSNDKTSMDCTIQTGACCEVSKQSILPTDGDNKLREATSPKTVNAVWLKRQSCPSSPNPNYLCFSGPPISSTFPSDPVSTERLAADSNFRPRRKKIDTRGPKMKPPNLI